MKTIDVFYDVQRLTWSFPMDNVQDCVIHWEIMELSYVDYFVDLFRESYNINIPRYVFEFMIAYTSNTSSLVRIPLMDKIDTTQ
jgi:hypothetical protein